MRDIVKRCDWAILGIENQQKTDYSMPIRDMLYDSLAYMEQMKTLTDLRSYQKKINRENEEEPEAEPEELAEDIWNVLQMEDRLYPCLTVVIYYGSSPWNGAKRLHDLLELDEELREYVADYKLNLICVREAESFIEALKDPNVHQFFYLVKTVLNKQKKELEQMPPLNREAVVAAASVLGSPELLENLEERKENVNMCELFEEIKKEGREQGREEGKEQGREEGKLNMLQTMTINLYKNGLSPEQIADAANESVERIADWLKEAGVFSATNA